MLVITKAFKTESVREREQVIQIRINSDLHNIVHLYFLHSIAKRTNEKNNKKQLKLLKKTSFHDIIICYIFMEIERRQCKGSSQFTFV